MAIAGAGAGVNELTALAATSEMAPTRKRGVYVAVLIFTIVPFCPSVLWAQLIAYYSNWRYVGAFCGAWAAFGLLITVFFYFPPPRVNSMGLSRREILSRVDYVVAFGFWEVYGAKYPIFPSKLKQEPRTLGLTLVITFISGANFFSVLMFWPTESFNVYGHDPVAVGIRSIPIGFSILGGACIVLTLLSVFRGHNKELLIISCGALAIGRLDNLYQLWGILVLAGLGIGGIVVPASIITTIICPDDLIATISALTLSIRVVGGGVGYAIYYNVFISKFVPLATEYIGGVMEMDLGITDPKLIGDAIELTGASLLTELKTIPGIGTNETAYNMVVTAGQMAYAQSYKYVYYVSIAFGAISIFAACFLGSIEKYMTDHVAVVM
ncbi:hypothetical protein N7474_002387 [Penicillium riverlandense]|uniref:uncharacterized protein n=1 Tax=Penicillium riverlandense TaxID=1903569 RepID=UPI0025489D55|nr:uncharacterized protein N7474_002387 [Penicillium riverlandense]KAJ5825249.1 hypothetical protein N7474_002387 [Penicillium riverlandense]